MSHEDTRNWRQFYPEIRDAGTLTAVVAGKLAAAGSAFKPTPVSGADCATCENGARIAQMIVAALERLFLLEFWSNGVWMGMGKTPHLEHAVAAMQQWVSQPEQRTAQFCKSFPWVKPTEQAAAFEEGTEVEWQWQSMLHKRKYLPEVHALIVRAAREPRLRMLYPYTSMHTLRFSRCTSFPYTNDTPCIIPLWNGQYRVFFQVEPEVGPELGRGDLNAVIEIILQHLPPGIGPAKSGTLNNDETRKD